MNPNSPIKTKKKHRPQYTLTKTNHNQFEGNSEHMNSNVAPQISFKSSSDIRHKKQIHKKSNNKVNKLWKIFQTKNDSEKTRNKDGHHEDAIPSDNEERIT